LLVPVYCHVNAENQHSMDMMVAVRGGFSKFDTTTRSTRKGHSIPFGDNLKAEEDKEDDQQVLPLEEETENAEALALTAVVLAALAMSCLTGLAIKSWTDTRAERQRAAKGEQNISIQEEATSPKSLSPLSSKVPQSNWPTWLPLGAITTATPDPRSPSQTTPDPRSPSQTTTSIAMEISSQPQAQPRFHRLLSLSAGPYIYERK